MSPVSRLLSHISCLPSPVSRLLSYVSCLMSTVSRFLLTSPVSCLLSHVSCLTSPSHFYRLTSPVYPKPLLSHVSCLTSHASCLQTHVSCLIAQHCGQLCQFNLFQTKTNYMYHSTSNITPSQCQSPTIISSILGFLCFKL